MNKNTLLQEASMPYDLSQWTAKKPKFYDLNIHTLNGRMLSGKLVSDILRLFLSSGAVITKVDREVAFNYPMRSVREAYVRLKLAQFEYRVNHGRRRRLLVALKLPPMTIRCDIIHTFVAMIQVAADATTSRNRSTKDRGLDMGLEPRGLPAFIFRVAPTDMMRLSTFVDIIARHLSMLFVCPVLSRCYPLKSRTPRSP